MDPLSIATGAAGLANGFAKIGKTLFTWIQDTIEVDKNVSGLCEEVTALSQVLESISSASTMVSQTVVAEIDPKGQIWVSVKATMNDIDATLDELNQLLADVQKSSVFSRSFLRKPLKQFKFSKRLKEITILKERMKLYNSGMTSALQMINVCLSVHGHSSQQSVVSILSGLKSSIRRVEFALQASNKLEANSIKAGEEENRIFQNLKEIVRTAEDFHSNATVIVCDDARSTVRGGSIIGDPLTAEEFSKIESWIPPLDADEKKVESRPAANSASSKATAETDSSDSETDIEKELAKQFEELAIQNQEIGDHAKAENFYRRAIEKGEANQRSQNEILAMKVNLAYTCMYQGKWTDAETVLDPIAWGKNPTDVKVFHGLHGLALSHMEKFNFEAAEKYCKRALWGKRKLLGKSDPSSCETLALLASICDARNDPIEAEAHRSLLPASFQLIKDNDVVAYLDRSSGMEQTQSSSSRASQVQSLSSGVSKSTSPQTNVKNIFAETHIMFGGEVLFNGLPDIPDKPELTDTVPIFLRNELIDEDRNFMVPMKAIYYLTDHVYSRYPRLVEFDVEILSCDSYKCSQYDSNSKIIGRVKIDLTHVDPGSTFPTYRGGGVPFYLIEYSFNCQIHKKNLSIQGYFQGYPVGPNSVFPLV